MKSKTPCRGTLASAFHLLLSAVATSVVTLALTTAAFAGVFTYNPVEQPTCRPVEGARTAREALQQFKRQFGGQVQVLQPLTPHGSSGGMAAVIELPTVHGYQAYAVIEGTQADCTAFGKSAPPKEPAGSSASGAVEGPNWLRFSAAEGDRPVVYVDVNSVRVDAQGLIRLWIRQDHKADRHSASGQAYRRSIGAFALDCGDQTTAPTAVGFYDTKGGLVEQAELERAKWTFTQTPPDSLQMSLLRAHCGRIR